MCGICGIISVSPEERFDPSAIDRMRETLHHRGPDDAGRYLAPGAALGHRRLSIIDLRPEGRQPMSNEDGTLWIVYNGEIYNFAEHREWLIERGHRFRSLTDTEVILHLYEELGEECLERLRGMFAFAIWDQRRRALFMARDRVGKKPLFYLWNGRHLIFGSEPKAILAYPGVEAAADPAALNLYLAFGYVPGPLSAFRGINKLPAGHFLTLRDGRVEVKRYWQLDYLPKLKIGPAEAREEIVRRLSEAVKLRMVSDVPIGALLSGGIDSSAVVALMTRHSSRPVKTFSIGFREKDYDETVYARMIAQRFHTEHHELQIEPDALEIIDRLVWHYNEPFADPSALPTLYLCKMAREQVTVALNGDGGDENFAGYVRHSVMLLASYVGWMPAAGRQSIGHVMAMLFRLFGPAGRLKRHRQVLPETFRIDPRDAYASLLTQANRFHREALYSPEFAREVDPSAPEDCVHALQSARGVRGTIDSMLNVDVNLYLPDDLLVKFDIAAMSYGLETRSPMLDQEFMEFVARLPARLKMNTITRKLSLKKAMRGILPDEILFRRKMGFGVPLDHWFRGEKMGGYLRDHLLDARSSSRGYFNRGYIELLIEEHTKGRRQWQYLLWNLLMLELWHRAFIDQAAQYAAHA